MEIKVMLESYKDIQEFKRAMNAQCDKMVKDLSDTFTTKQVDILNQIDGYLKGICAQLKGSKMFNGADWQFNSNDRWKNSDDTYPSRVIFILKDNGDYYLKVRLFSQFSGENFYIINIQDGNIRMVDYEHCSKKQQYIETIIKNWKDLKAIINNTIMKDLEESQKRNNNMLNNIVTRNSLYESFEL